MAFRVRLADFYIEKFRPRRRIDTATGTEKLDWLAMRQFSAFLGRPALLRDLTEDSLSAFLAHFSQSHAIDTANRTVKRLMAIGNYAARKRYLKEAPEVKYLRAPERLPRAYTAEQIGRLLESIGRLKTRVTGFLDCDWWNALVQVIYWTGLRLGAAMAVQQADVDLESRTALVRAETQKQRADQLFRLHPDCSEAIERIWVPERKLLFPWDHSLSTFYRHFKAILVQAGLPHSRRDLFQRIRRTTYSYCKLGGIDAGSQLGHHSDMSRFYEDPLITGQRQACDVLPRPIPPRPNLRIV